MSVRLKDLAKQTGYSISTISRALLGYSDVNPATRKKILEAAKRLDYYPSQIAKQLRSGRTRTIGFLIPTYGERFSDPFFIELLTGIGDMASLMDYDILVGTSGDGEKELEEYRRVVGGGRVEGLIITRTRIRDQRVSYLLKTHTPFILLGRVLDHKNVPYIDIDSRSGIKILTRHLIESGHRRIGFITTPDDLVFTKFRNQGYREALKEAGIPYDPDIVEIGNLTLESGKSLGLKLLSRKDRPTAIVAVNDLMALGTYGAAQQLGLTIGRDVSITGYDGISLSKNAHPPLTTIEVPIYEIGKQLFEMLYKLINHENLGESQILLPPKAVFRESVGSPA